MTDFFPPQPNLYTVEAHGRPVVVMSVISVTFLPSDAILAIPGVMEAERASAKVYQMMVDDQMSQGLIQDPSEFEDLINRREVDEALETYLGADLQIFEEVANPGGPLWDGDWENLCVRRATDDEAGKWKQSLLSAIQAGEEEPGETSWLTFLVPVREIKPRSKPPRANNGSSDAPAVRRRRSGKRRRA